MTATKLREKLARRQALVVPGCHDALSARVIESAGFMLCAAMAFLLAPEFIAGLFTSDLSVRKAGGALLAVAAFFQLFDGVQVVATGVLRGAGDTRTPMVCHLVGYWLIGLPVGYLLCFTLGWGAPGLWIGLCLALILIGVALLLAWSQATHTLASAP